MTSVILTCPSCGQKNRVPAVRLGEGPRCGKCHQAGMPAAPLDTDEQTLTGLIQEGTLPLLVDFWAPWCGPCRMVAPILAQVAQDHPGQVLVVKVNADDHPGASARHGVQGIPTLVLFQGGREVNRLVGAHPRRDIDQMLGQVLGPGTGARRPAPAAGSSPGTGPVTI